MIDSCSKLMLKHNVNSLIVTDQRAKDKGIITKTDIIELFAYHQSAT
jgi:predicted transcriptional regulator